MSEDIAQYALDRMEHDVSFSSQAIQELGQASKQVKEIYSLSIIAFQSGDGVLAQKVCREESEFDKLYWQIRQSHIERLEKGRCQPEADVIFTETMRLLERISDHADNLGVSVARSARP
jgi:phosphate:Na+ symporter